MSGDSGPTAEDWRQGRRRLRALLPWARAEFRRRGDVGTFSSETGLGYATMPYVTEANLDALLIYQAPLGGWHCDIAMKRVPPGIPPVMGTPVGSPLKTREEAEAHAKLLLLACLAIAAQKPPAEGGKPIFLLYDWKVALSPEVYEAALKAMPGHPGFASKERAVERLEEVIAELGITPEFNGPEFMRTHSNSEQALLWAVLHQAALTGLYVYPPRRDASPSGHSHSETSARVH